ncbi:MAG: PH domain-containing protein [Candidatus Micrarchaeota archaeon]|nr:PH domain-containing protein [Candidatus Micrarchaeota archaeon]
MQERHLRTLEEVRQVLDANEHILLILRQSYLSSISPDSVVVTDARVILVHHSFWGLYTKMNVFSPTRMSIVPYKNIISVMMTKGRLLATVTMRLHGHAEDISEGGYEWKLNGIRISGATKLTGEVGRIVQGYERAKAEEKGSGDTTVVSMKGKETKVEHATVPLAKSKLYGRAVGAALVILGIANILGGIGIGPFVSLRESLELRFADSLMFILIGLVLVKLA